jgi:hypothetical protein
MLTWTPGWGQLRLPVATHLLIMIVLLRHDFSVWTAVLFGLLLISVLREARKYWLRIGRAFRISLPLDSPSGSRQVVRLIWSLPRWVTVELASPVGREVVDIFDSEMADDEWAMLRRWAQLDKQRFSRRRAGGRPADP